MRKSRFFLTILIICLCTLPELSLGAKNPRKDSSFFSKLKFQRVEDISLGLGVLNRYLSKFQVNLDGKKNGLEFIPFLSAGLRYDIYPNFFFTPEAAITIPQSSVDQGHTVIQYFLKAPIGYKFYSLIIQLGFGLYFTTTMGSGGNLKLNNGTDTTTYKLPQGMSAAVNVTQFIALEYYIHRMWSIKSDVEVLNLLDSTSRSTNLLMAVNYHLFH
ncbi:MAG: hypothetical protein ISR65_11490 [Bacteriovoracaceae bacterium]|nr:hypothetical protein [Bacteriovoracaceae bacterium]